MERKLKGTVLSMPQLLHTQVALILLVVLTIYKKIKKVIVKKKEFLFWANSYNSNLPN